MYINTAIHRI